MSTNTKQALLSDNIPFSEFRANCSRILDRVEETGDSVTITKNGRPVAVVAPCPNQSEGFWERLGELIEVDPSIDIDNLDAEDWGVDWCPIHEVAG